MKTLVWGKIRNLKAIQIQIPIRRKYKKQRNLKVTLIQLPIRRKYEKQRNLKATPRLCTFSQLTSLQNKCRDFAAGSSQFYKVVHSDTKETHGYGSLAKIATLHQGAHLINPGLAG
jgi:hypothetical protein